MSKAPIRPVKITTVIPTAVHHAETPGAVKTDYFAQSIGGSEKRGLP
jgi:hypothetical protein